MPSPSPTWSVIVLAGGRGTRLGGADKAALDLAGTPALDLVLRGIPADVPVVVAGPARPTGRPVRFRPESPPLSGPMAGIAAALRDVHTEFVAIVAVDSPWSVRLLPDLVATLVASPADVCVPLDSSGRVQPLCAAWRTQALRSRLVALGDPRDLPVRLLLQDASVLTKPVTGGEEADLEDIDTPDELARARRRANDGAAIPDRSDQRSGPAQGQPAAD